MAMNEGITPVWNIAGERNGGAEGFGSGGGWIFFLFILLLFRDGNGFGGNGNTETFALNNVERKLDGISNGLCSSTYDLNTSILNGFAGVDRGLCDIGYKIQSCCCETNRNIDASRFEAQKNTCDIITNANMNTRDLIEAGNHNTQRIVDLITQDKLDGLRQELATAQLQLSQQAQSANLIERLKPCSIPAYIVPNPCCPCPLPQA